MSNSGQGRRIVLQIFRNFINSFTTRKAELKGKYVGEDLFGNKFYENTLDLERGKRNARRSFEPLKDMHFDVDNMSAEWDAWLRHRRKEPPTIEELKANLAISQAKVENARRKAEAAGKLPTEQSHSDMHSFPTYDEYEVNPGKGTTKFDDGK